MRRTTRGLAAIILPAVIVAIPLAHLGYSNGKRADATTLLITKLDEMTDEEKPKVAEEVPASDPLVETVEVPGNPRKPTVITHQKKGETDTRQAARHAKKITAVKAQLESEVRN